MAYVPNTDEDRSQMLESIGVKNFAELISAIPDQIQLDRLLEIPEAVSEYEIIKILKNYSEQNISSDTHACFMGGGAYDRFVPTIVSSVLERPEFKTAYTPYQAEVSQGTLQAMYEFQSMICELTGMEVANASLYDGGSALAEAVLMANAQNKGTKILLAGQINPNYLKVLQTVVSGKEFEIISCVSDDGTADLDALDQNMDKSVTAVLLQQPNFYGTLEEIAEIEKIAHKHKALFVVSVDPISLGIIEAPGNYGADVVTGEGQSLGIPLSYGGPYLGIFAARKKFVRKLPGRIAGITQDSDGNRGYVLTLQTREQQIKREKATSNICTNQGLFMLAATVYMEAYGKQGIREVAEQSFSKAHYLADKINSLPGFSLSNEKPFFNEFLVKTPVPAEEIQKAGLNEKMLCGIATSRIKFDGLIDGLLVAVTEKRSKEEIDKFVDFLSNFK